MSTLKVNIFRKVGVHDFFRDFFQNMYPTPPDPPRMGKVSMFWAALAELRRSRTLFFRKCEVFHGFFNFVRKKSEVNIFQDGISEVNVLEKNN